MKVNGNGYFAVRHSCARGILIVLRSQALFQHLHITNKNIVIILIEFTATGSQGSHDTAPVGVTTCERALPERRERDSAGSFDRVELVLRALHMYCHQLRCPFAITSHLTCQVLRYAAQGLAERS